MDGYRQTAAVDMVGGVKKLLEKLRVKDTDEEIKACLLYTSGYGISGGVHWIYAL